MKGRPFTVLRYWGMFAPRGRIRFVIIVPTGFLWSPVATLGRSVGATSIVQWAYRRDATMMDRAPFVFRGN